MLRQAKSTVKMYRCLWSTMEWWWCRPDHKLWALHLAGGHHVASGQDLNFSLKSERHICHLQLVACMGGALLCWSAAAAYVGEHSAALRTVSQLSCRCHRRRWMNEGERSCRIWVLKCEGATLEMRETESLTWKYWSDRSKLVDA